MKLLHLKILLAVWIVVILVGLIVSKELLVANVFSPRVMNLTTFLWICSCIIAFWGGTFIERSLYAGKSAAIRTRIDMPVISAVKFEKVLRTLKGMLFLLTGLILIRFVWCVLKVGSLKGTVFLIGTKSNVFRFDIWQQTSIHGMGALSDTIVACTIFAFASFGLMKKYRSNVPQLLALGYSEERIKRYHRTSGRFLFWTLLLFSFYSVLSGERVVIVMGILGGLLAYHMILRRFSLRNFAYLALFFLIVWIVVEGYRRSQWHDTESFDIVLQYAMDRLLLYLAPSLRNVDIVVNYIPGYTYGWFTFNFIPTAFKMDFLQSMNDCIYAFSPYHVVPGFGAIPLFGTTYADFGAASLLYFVVIGFIYERLYRKAILRNSFLAIQLYAYFLVPLVISFMPFLPMLARFWVNVIALVILNKSVRII